MNRFFLLLPLLCGIGVGTAYATPLENINTEIIEFNDNSATVQMSWNQDDSVYQYEIGCVSCFPNFSEITNENSIILTSLTSIGDNLIVLLYMIAYDSEDEIVSAKQIFVELK